LATTEHELVQKKVENKNLSDTLKAQVSSKQVDDDTQLAVDSGVKTVEKTTTTIAETHTRNVQKIEAKYDKLPDTADNNKAREDEISRDRVQRLWEVYCIANPDHEHCLPKPASAAVK
jgi:hypothetical protein